MHMLTAAMKQTEQLVPATVGNARHLDEHMLSVGFLSCVLATASVDTMLAKMSL
jgi:hypothetical protein